MSNQRKHQVACVKSLDKTKIIDVEGALDLMGGSKKMYKGLIERYLEAAKFEQNIKLIGEGVENKDTEKMKLGSHNIKGSCGYIGASKLHYATYNIHRKWEEDNNDYEGMLYYYQRVIESGIEFKIYLRKFLANMNKTPFKPNVADQSVYVAKGYCIEYDQITNFFYCLRGNQSIEERIIEIKEQELEESNQESKNGQNYQGHQGDQKKKKSSSQVIDSVPVNSAVQQIPSAIQNEDIQQQRHFENNNPDQKEQYIKQEQQIKIQQPVEQQIQQQLIEEKKQEPQQELVKNIKKMKFGNINKNANNNNTNNQKKNQVNNLQCNNINNAPQNNNTNKQEIQDQQQEKEEEKFNMAVILKQSITQKVNDDPQNMPKTQQNTNYLLAEGTQKSIQQQQRLLTDKESKGSVLNKQQMMVESQLSQMYFSCKNEEIQNVSIISSQKSSPLKSNNLQTQKNLLNQQNLIIQQEESKQKESALNFNKQQDNEIVSSNKKTNNQFLQLNDFQQQNQRKSFEQYQQEKINSSRSNQINKQQEQQQEVNALKASENKQLNNISEQQQNHPNLIRNQNIVTFAGEQLKSQNERGNSIGLSQNKNNGIQSFEMSNLLKQSQQQIRKQSAFQNNESSQEQVEVINFKTSQQKQNDEVLDKILNSNRSHGSKKQVSHRSFHSVSGSKPIINQKEQQLVASNDQLYKDSCNTKKSNCMNWYNEYFSDVFKFCK